jgi:hypothetical protein
VIRVRVGVFQPFVLLFVSITDDVALLPLKILAPGHFAWELQLGFQMLEEDFNPFARVHVLT